MHRLRPSARVLLFSLLAAFAVLATGGTEPARAAKKAFEDPKRGFRVRIEDSFVQTPPKLTSDDAHVVAEWYEDSAKFDASLRPELKIVWFATPKAATVTPDSTSKPEGAAPSGDGKDALREWREANRPKSVDEVADQFLERADYYFGPFVPSAERWKAASKDRTVGKHDLTYFEVNVPGAKKPPKKKEDKKDKDKGKDKGAAGEPERRQPWDDPNWEPMAYMLVAKLTLDRPGEMIEVGFVANCEINHAKKMRSEFLATVRSFEELKSATDSLNLAAGRELDAEDPVKFREAVRKQKLIPGWKALDTKNYLVVYHDEVDPVLVRKIATEIEAIRAQIYEVLFPPDRPIRVCSVVRVCKDPEQYHQYGGPGGSAGYWYPPGMELVFYEDQSNKKDSLRVLYHEAFHQYIFYSVGDFSPHSWFNEGHGDFFSGHNFVGGKFQVDEFQWRVSLAKEWKRNPKRPPLADWLKWTQYQYYGGNKEGIPGGVNYALGWSFVHFLRTTKKPEYQGILDRYFNSLKGSVTQARAAREAREKKRKEGPKPPAGNGDGEKPPPEGGDGSGNDAGNDGDDVPDDGPGTPAPEAPDAPSLEEFAKEFGSQDQWLKKALEDAFRGVDLAKLEKDWIEN